MSEPDPFVNFRYEYVSGFMSLLQQDAYINVFSGFIANRGTTQEIVRTYLSRGKDTMYDSGNVHVPPGDMPWLEVPGVAVYEPAKEAGGIYWARIFTTSANLVPSAEVTNEKNDPPTSQRYFAPGDFAVFELPDRTYSPPAVPIGPVHI